MEEVSHESLMLQYAFKRPILTLIKMDNLFGSVGAAAADTERMEEITREIGLVDVVKGASISGPGANEPKVIDEKMGTETRERDTESY